MFSSRRIFIHWAITPHAPRLELGTGAGWFVSFVKIKLKERSLLTETSVLCASVNCITLIKIWMKYGTRGSAINKWNAEYYHWLYNSIMGLYILTISNANLWKIIQLYDCMMHDTSRKSLALVYRRLYPHNILSSRSSNFWPSLASFKRFLSALWFQPSIHLLLWKLFFDDLIHTQVFCIVMLFMKELFKKSTCCPQISKSWNELAMNFI